MYTSRREKHRCQPFHFGRDNSAFASEPWCPAFVPLFLSSNQKYQCVLPSYRTIITGRALSNDYEYIAVINYYYIPPSLRGGLYRKEYETNTVQHYMLKPHTISNGYVTWCPYVSKLHSSQFWPWNPTFCSILPPFSSSSFWLVPMESQSQHSLGLRLHWVQ